MVAVVEHFPSEQRTSGLMLVTTTVPAFAGGGGLVPRGKGPFASPSQATSNSSESNMAKESRRVMQRSSASAAPPPLHARGPRGHAELNIAAPARAPGGS